MKKKHKIILVILGSLCLIGLGASIYAYDFLKADAVEREGSIYVPTGADYRQLTDSLRHNGYLKNMGRFDRTARILKFGDNVRPGHYVIKNGMSYPQVVRMFQRGLQSPVKVTFNNIRSLPQLAGRIAQQIEPDSAMLSLVLQNDTTSAHYGFSKPEFLAMFIPDTYEMYWNVSPTGFLDRMKREYERFWNEDRRSKLSAINLTPAEAVTLASIVFEETKMSDEMPVVAGVYINRLRKGMKLQADPTVKYAVGDFTLRRILFRHLEVDSPYNTYMYAGLPPGPVSMPPVTAIDAVLNYTHHNYIYFCARPDFSGYHNFAVTLAEHNRNRDAWIAAVNRAGIR